jgi:hypothetical protein
VVGKSKIDDIDNRYFMIHTIHMKHTKYTKRTNLVLDGNSLKTLVALLGEKTYSAAVQTVFDDAISRLKALTMLQFMGKDVWRGKLSPMREDSH